MRARAVGKCQWAYQTESLARERLLFVVLGLSLTRDHPNKSELLIIRVQTPRVRASSATQSVLRAPDRHEPVPWRPFALSKEVPRARAVVRREMMTDRFVGFLALPQAREYSNPTPR